MIQYSATPMNFCDGGDYWIPAFAGMMDWGNNKYCVFLTQLVFATAL